MANKLISRISSLYSSFDLVNTNCDKVLTNHLPINCYYVITPTDSFPTDVPPTDISSITTFPS